MAINEEKLHHFISSAMVDLGALVSAPLVIVGERLGLYKAMAEAGPASSEALAQRTGTHERYVREWLRNQAASGYVTYHPDTDRYSISEEHAFALTDKTCPAYLPTFFNICLGQTRSAAAIVELFRTGGGIHWADHEPEFFLDVEQAWKRLYTATLAAAWIPALEGVEAKLKKGVRVADIGCGHGNSTVIMAKEYPDSTFLGFDFHGPSIEIARARAKEAGVADRVRFEVATGASYPGNNYDFVTCFDCLHDMGDPVGTSAHVLESLASDGTWMIVEPNAADRVEDNLNPIGRYFYGVSTLLCTPCAMAQEGGFALGTQAGEANIRGVVTAGGFSRFRRAAESPFNLVFEARP